MINNWTGNATFEKVIWYNFDEITIGSLYSGNVPCFFELAYVQYNNFSKNIYQVIPLSEIIENSTGNVKLKVTNKIIDDNAITNLFKKEDNIFMTFDGVSSYVFYDNKPGITQEYGKLHFKIKVPTDIVSNQMLFSWDNQMMITFINKQLYVYNRTHAIYVHIEEYINQVIIVTIEKTKVIATDVLRVYINGTLKNEVNANFDATYNPETLSIGSYEASALFSALDFYWIIKTDSNDNIEWIVNPYTKSSRQNNVGYYINDINLQSTNKEQFNLNNIPDTIYLTNNKQYNLYGENILPGYNDNGYHFEIIDTNNNLNIFNQNKNIRFELTDTGTFPVKLNLYNSSGTHLYSKDVTLNVSDINKGSGTKQILFCGDSLTDDALTGHYDFEGPALVREFYTNCE